MKWSCLISACFDNQHYFSNCMLKLNYYYLLYSSISGNVKLFFFGILFLFFELFLMCHTIEENNHHNDNCTLPQAEIYATYHAAHILTEDRCTEKNIFIGLDSQAAIRSFIT